jgi:CBS domain-containing protein
MTSAVRDVMTTHVVAVRQYTGFKDIAMVLRRRRLSALPVLADDDRVVGVVSEADLLLREAFPAAPDGGRPHRPRDRARAAALTAADLMTSPPITVGPGCAVAEAARLMHRRRVKRLPVVSGSGHLAGIVSRIDLLSLYDRADADIRAEIIEDVLAGQLGLEPGTIGVQVGSGIVTLAGAVNDETVAVGVLDSIWCVDGVIDVRDRLDYTREDGPL